MKFFLLTCLFSCGILTTSVVAEDVRVETLSGKVTKGTALEDISINSVHVTVDNKLVKLDSKDILRVILGDESTAETSYPLIRLVDGSQLPIDSFALKKTTANVVLKGQSDALKIPRALIASVRFKKPTPSIANQWKEINSQEAASDILVIRRKSAIDYLEGQITSATSEKIFFVLDDDTIPVSMKKVDGLVFYHLRKKNVPPALFRLKTKQGAILQVQKVVKKKDSDRTLFTGMKGLQISVKRSDILLLDYSSGKLKYLSDLTPQKVESTSVIGWPVELKLGRALQRPVFDSGFYTKKLVVRIPPLAEARHKRFRIEEFTRGVGIRPTTELTYRVPAGFEQFNCVAGIDAEMEDLGSVQLTFYGNGKELLKKNITGKKGAESIRFSLQGVRKLKIVVDDQGDGDAGDRLYLCNARFTK